MRNIRVELLLNRINLLTALTYYIALILVIYVIDTKLNKSRLRRRQSAV